jgi:Protein of unknown function (DUF3732)
MQLRSVVLYHRDGKRMHEVVFDPGSLNVIPGISETGKSALIRIVDYCLGSSKHRVSKEPELESIGWYGLLLDISGSPTFVARQRPTFGQKASDRAMILTGRSAAPEPGEIGQTTNIRTVVKKLGGMIGIGDTQTPATSGSDSEVRATLRHAVSYVFQPQRLIADPLYLFHGQDEEKRFHIRDTLPYFLGAVDTDQIRQRRDLQQQQRTLRGAKRRLADLESPPPEVSGRLDLLATEAREVGLLTESELADSTDRRTLLHATLAKPLEEAAVAMTGDAAAIAELRSRKDVLTNQLRETRIARRSLLDHKRLAEDFDHESQQHAGRLTSLQLLPDGDGTAEACPLCGSTEHEDSPTIADLRQELDRASAQAMSSAAAPPQLDAAINETDEQIRHLRDELNAVDHELKILIGNQRQESPGRTEIQQQAFVRGRIAGFLDEHPTASVDDLAGLRAEVESLTEEVEGFEESLGTEATRTRTENSLSYVSDYMTEMAQRLGLSYAEDGVRLDPVQLTVIGKDPRGPVHLNEEDIGGGKSWVGYHIVTLLALHRYFIERGRPVPHMLLLDQPTQAFYPSEKQRQKDRGLTDLSDDDQAQVHRIFELLRDTVNDLEGKLQVVVVDHAEIAEDWFAEAVGVNNWRHGQALVPKDWF